MREREILNPGSRLLLGITEYEIQEVAGQGSNAIVYRAVYKDGVEKNMIIMFWLKSCFRGIKTGKYTEKKTEVFSAVRGRENFLICTKKVSEKETGFIWIIWKLTLRQHLVILIPGTRMGLFIQYILLKAGTL